MDQSFLNDLADTFNEIITDYLFFLGVLDSFVKILCCSTEEHNLFTMRVHKFLNSLLLI